MYLLIFSQFPFIIRGTDASKEVPKVLFQYLDRQMLVNCRLVCKDWRNYIDLNTINSDFWYSQLPNSEELPFFLADGLMKCRNDKDKSMMRGYWNFYCSRIILKRAKINTERHNGTTPLHVAATEGNSEMCKLVQSR